MEPRPIPRMGFLPHSCCGFCLWGIDRHGPRVWMLKDHPEHSGFLCARVCTVPQWMATMPSQVASTGDAAVAQPQTRGVTVTSGTQESCSSAQVRALASKSCVQGSLRPGLDGSCFRFSKTPWGICQENRQLGSHLLQPCLTEEASLPRRLLPWLILTVKQQAQNVAEEVLKSSLRPSEQWADTAPGSGGRVSFGWKMRRRGGGRRCLLAQDADAALRVPTLHQHLKSSLLHT